MKSEMFEVIFDMWDTSQGIKGAVALLYRHF